MDKLDLYKAIKLRFSKNINIKIPFIDSCLDVFENIVK
jgi:hypothetical protein